MKGTINLLQIFCTSLSYHNIFLLDLKIKEIIIIYSRMMNIERLYQQNIIKLIIPSNRKITLQQIFYHLPLCSYLIKIFSETRERIQLCVIFKHIYLAILNYNLKVVQKFLIFFNFIPVLEFSSYLLCLLRWKR